MSKLQRRQAILAMAASATTLCGCGSDSVDDAVADLSTPTLENARVGLRGFQIVAFMVGKRLVQLPHPAVRILGVALLTSGAATYLVIEYLSVELNKRSVREALEEQELAAIESALAVEFVTENGFTESVALGPNQYEPE